MLFIETREFVDLDVFAKIGLLVVLLLISFSPVNIPPLRMFFLFLFLSGPLLIDTLMMRFSKKFFKIIILDDSTLKVVFINGRARDFLVEKTKKYSFDPEAKNAHIVLSDGTMLQHLERLSDWPTLREYLLEKLESRKRA